MNDILLQPQKGNQLTSKLIILAILVAISWGATMFVWGVIQDRESRQETASNEISEQWSRPQVIGGPVLTVPVEKTLITTTGEKEVNKTTLTLLPKSLSYESQIASELLARGVYETPVYTTIIKGSGNFDLSDMSSESLSDIRILWDKAIVSIDVSDTRGISSAVNLMFNGGTHQMLPSSDFATLDGSGVHANVVIDPNKPNFAFSFELPLKGSKGISFLPLGESTAVVVKSNWNAPSFTGEFLPEARSITESGFEANWKVTSYGKNIPQYWFSNESTVTSELLLSKAFGVGLYQEVDLYTMIDRSLKYSILFICLTFLTFFMYEVLAGLRIHPMQYFFVGLAIAVFYLLLLSFAEIIGFLPAYFVASIATTVLITSYCFSVLKAKKRALSIAALLTALYSYLYILLQMDQYALLFGSVLLFSVLATVMYITKDLDWYSLNNKDS